MKKTSNRTEYVLIRAGNEHPMYYVDFAIIHVTEGWRREMWERHCVAERLPMSETMFHLIYHEAPVGYFASDEDKMDIDDFITTEQPWTFFELEENELKTLEKRNCQLEHIQLFIDRDSNAFYRATDLFDYYETAAFDIVEMCGNPMDNQNQNGK